METSENNLAIRVRDLSKSFGEQRVLDRIDMEVAAGETLTVLGRSGTGKSVLLKLLIGLQRPDGGEIEINGERITRMQADELNRVRRTIGFLFQQAALYDSLSVEENVAFPLRRHTTMSEEELKGKARELLGRVGMAEAAAKMPDQLSGGMKKRVGLARALALEPAILLLDEPTSALDPITAAEINELIRELKDERRIASVVVTHDLRSVERVADRVAMIDAGSVVFEGSYEELKRSNDEFVSKFVRDSREVN